MVSIRTNGSFPGEEHQISPSFPTRALALSRQKYGDLLLADGFTQYPRSVEDYLNTLDLCSTAKLLVITLLSYRWQHEQEVYPSVRTLAERCGVSTRRVNQLTAHLCDLGLLVKTERFAGSSQLSNAYDLEPLLEKTAAWKDAEVAAALAEEEAHADEPFVPADLLEEAALILSEEFGEPEPRRVRYTVRRLGRRFDQHPHLEWPTFFQGIEQTVKQTEARQATPTRTNQAFTKLLPYFFSALDFWLSRQQPAPISAQPLPRADQPDEQQARQHPSPATARQSPGPQQTARKGGVLAERARARREAEAAGQAKIRVPETLALHIKAAALTFNDDQEKSSVRRAANLMADARLDEQTMLDLVAEARAATSHSHAIQKKNRHGKINRMPYFFALLEKLLEEKITATIPAHV